MSTLLLISLLFAPPLSGTDTGLWGLQLGASPDTVRATYAPTGTPQRLEWSQAQADGVHRLYVRCKATDLCFAVPAEGDFVFIEGRLVAATLRADAERAPSAHPARETLLGISASSGLTVADASARSVGRFTRYFLRPHHTVAWVQDGPDVEIKLYLDSVVPLGRAEAVAAGARASLDAFPGAALYARAHGAIAQRDFDGAISALEGLSEMKKGSRLLREQATLVLAMALAARAQKWGREPKSAPENWARRAATDLARAAAIAPSLASEFEALGKRIASEKTTGPK